MRNPIELKRSTSVHKSVDVAVLSTVLPGRSRDESIQVSPNVLAFVCLFLPNPKFGLKTLPDNVSLFINFVG